MFKSALVLILFSAVMNVYGQITPLAATEINSDGLIKVSDISCFQNSCTEDGQVLVLPFALEIEGSEEITIANIEMYLAHIITKEFKTKLKAYKYSGGVKLFGIKLDEFGAEDVSNRLLSINIASVNFIGETSISADGKKKLLFNLSATLGAAKPLRQFPQLSQSELEYIEDQFGLRQNIYASITFEMDKVQITGYGMIDKVHLGNTNIKTKSLGVELQYNLNFKRRGDLSIFAGIEYATHNRNSSIALKPITELVFKTGLRYTLPSFKKKSRK
jgi:hypothetical protein